MFHGGDIYSDEIEYDFSVNLNPYDCSEILRKILDESKTKLCHYPDMKQRKFREALSLAEGVNMDELWGANGASSVIKTLILMINPKKVMLISPCFSGYMHAISLLKDYTIINHFLEEKNEYMLDDGFLERLEGEAKNGLELIVLANPNNPTGKNIPKNILEKAYLICKKYKVKMIIDECFLRLSLKGYSMSKYINDYEGLFVVNAFTKLFSIPGIRAGYVISNKKNIEKFVNYLPEWDMNAIADTAGIVCSEYIGNDQWLGDVGALIFNEKQYLCTELKKLGITVYESDSSFVLIKGSLDLDSILKKKKILIRNCTDFQGLGNGYYRIAIKTHKENEILINALNNKDTEDGT